MRTIQKQISLEPMTSRLPSVWPAYLNNEYYYFDDNSLKDREWQYTSNWGMVPVNIVVNTKPDAKEHYGATAYEDYYAVDGCHCYGGKCRYETSMGCGTCGSSSYDKLCNFVISFETLSKWYYFFNEYYNLLKQYSHCDRVYTSAEDYYNYESLTKYSDQMIYGTDKETYLELDRIFADRGGVVWVKIFNKKTSQYSWVSPETAHDEPRPDDSGMVDVEDRGFFKWICDNVVPSFVIPMQYKEYWKRDLLYYPDVIKWLAWFGQRLEYESVFTGGTNGEVDLWDCKKDENIDCCDCEEYFNRGGQRIYDKMNEWYGKIQSIIKANNAKMPKDGTCYIPTIVLPTELQVSIDDLGEFSIFSKDYELGVDYRVAHYGDTENTYGGTVATMDGDSIYLDKDGWGYAFDEDYMEKYVSSCLTCDYAGVFAEKCPKCGSRNVTQISYMPQDKENSKDAWISYTERYINHDYDCNDGGTYNHKNDFYVSAVTFYTYDENNVKYTASSSTSGNAITELKEKLSKKFPLTKRELGWMLINGELYEINETEYAKYDKRNKYLGNKTFLIFRDKGTNTPYTFIGGKKIFADFYLPTNEFYFPFFRTNENNDETTCSGRTFNIKNYKRFGREINDMDKIKYVEYDGNMYDITATTMIIDGYESYAVSGHAISDKHEMLYCLSGSGRVLYDDDGFKDYPDATSDDKKVTVEFKGEVNMYSVDEVTGSTVSKISDLRLYNVLTDDIGNNIEGIYDLSQGGIYNHQPPEGAVLDLIFQVGNTANVDKFSHTKEDIDDVITAKTFNGASDLRNYFVGDIITDMNFYYKNYADEPVSGTLYTVKLLPSDEIRISGATKNETVPASAYTSLSAITFSTEEKEKLETDENKIFKDDIYCDITYYKGATLSRKENSTYNLASKERNDVYKIDSASTDTFYYQNYGVEYTETVRFVKTNCEYYLKKPENMDNTLPSKRDNPCKHSVSYPVWIYVLTQDLTRIDESQYESEYSVPLANFRFDINVFSADTETDTFDLKYKIEMARHNDLQVFPVYREEYRFGIAALENVDSDIYIDRGINAAFEKHLKLGEVTSLEALEQYGNGYFKIMES